MKGAVNFIFNSEGWNEYWLFAPSPETLMAINLGSDEKQKKKKTKSDMNWEKMFVYI